PTSTPRPPRRSSIFCSGSTPRRAPPSSSPRTTPPSSRARRAAFACATARWYAKPSPHRRTHMLATLAFRNIFRNRRRSAITLIVIVFGAVSLTAAQITLMGLVSNGEKSETFLPTAVEPDKDRQMGAQRITAGGDLPSNESDAVILGRGLAASMHAKPGDYLTLMSTTTTGW